MTSMSLEADGADAMAPDPRRGGEDGGAQPKGPRMDGLSAGDYCHLAEECFVLAALAKNPDAAAKLVKTGDDYLRRAAGWRADQLRAPT
jgi:hypothetical protein